MTPRPALLVVAALVALGGTAWLFGSLREVAPPDESSGTPRTGDPSEPDRTPVRREPTEAGTSAGLATAAKRPEGMGSVRVRVLRGHDHSAVDGARVTVAGMSNAKTFVSRGVATEQQGVAGFDEIPVGEAYFVRVEAPGEPPVVREPVVVRADQETSIEVFVAAHGEVEGRVIGEDRAPVECASVAATLDAETYRGATEDPWPPTGAGPSALAFATTAKDGTFRIEGLPSGIVALRASADGYRVTVDRVRIPGGASGKADPVVLMLTKGRALAGVVVDGEGKGIGGAKIELGLSSDGLRVVRASTVTLPDGRFRLGAFAMKELNIAVRVSAAGHPTLYVPGRFELGEGVVLRLAGDARLEIVVTDGALKVPVANARILVQMNRPRTPGVWEGLTDATGLASMETPAGPIEMLYVFHPNYRAVRMYTQLSSKENGAPPISWEGDLATPLAAGQTRRAVIFPRRGFTLAGKVTDPSGAPVSRASLRLRYADDSPGLDVRSDGPASYRVDFVQPEHQPYLDADAPGYYPSSSRVDPQRAESDWVTLDVTLDPSAPNEARIKGRVLDPSGSGINGARVSHAPRPILTRSDGSYVLENMGADGKTHITSVSAVANGYLPGATPRFGFLARAGEVTEAPDLVLSQGDSIVGSVLTPDGKPVPLALVESIEGRAPLLRSTISGIDGRYALEALPPGDYQLEATAPGFLGWSTQGELSAGALPPVFEIRTYARATVTGRVQSSDGAAIQGAEVTADLTAPESIAVGLGVMSPVARTAITDAQGAFTIHGLYGQHTYTAKARGYDTWLMTITTSTGPVNFTLKPVGR